MKLKIVLCHLQVGSKLRCMVCKPLNGLLGDIAHQVMTACMMSKEAKVRSRGALLGKGHEDLLSVTTAPLHCLSPFPSRFRIQRLVHPSRLHFQSLAEKKVLTPQRSTGAGRSTL